MEQNHSHATSICFLVEDKRTTCTQTQARARLLFKMKSIVIDYYIACTTFEQTVY